MHSFVNTNICNIKQLIVGLMLLYPQLKCRYFCIIIESKSSERSARKLWLRIIDMRMRSAVSMLSFAKILYMFVRSHAKWRANHKTLLSCLTSSSRMAVPIDRCFIYEDVLLDGYKCGLMLFAILWLLDDLVLSISCLPRGTAPQKIKGTRYFRCTHIPRCLA